VQVLGTRRGGLITLALAAVALVVLAAFAVWQVVERPSVDTPLPTPGSAVSERTPQIAFSVPDSERLGDLTVRIDGDDVTGTARGAGDTVVVTPPAALKDGTHRVDVSFSSSNVFARSVSRSWEFDVDTTAPALAVSSPEPGDLRARRAVKFAGTAEAGATVTVAYEGGSRDATANADGAWEAIAKLPEGRVRATVSAADGAGNTARKLRRVVVDTTAPDLAISSPTGGDQITETD